MMMKTTDYFRTSVWFSNTFQIQTCCTSNLPFDEEMMHVSLTDGRIISVPIIWFPLLDEATPTQREHYEIGGGGVSLHWPEIDEDLSVAGLLSGGDMQSA